MGYSSKSGLGTTSVILALVLVLSAKVPEVKKVEFVTPNQIQLTFHSREEDYYVVGMTNDLSGDFTSLALQLGNEGQTTFVDSTADSRKFYVIHAFDRLNPDDWDGDGMDDLYEKSRTFLDPFDDSDAEKDPDFDGLTNLVEATTGTDPGRGDTDGDGFGDGDEMTYGSDPLVASSLPADPSWKYKGVASPAIVLRNDRIPATSGETRHVQTLNYSIRNDAAPAGDGANHTASTPFSVRNDLPPN